jgi:hypothetical protein
MLKYSITISVLELAKTVDALDRTATVIGMGTYSTTRTKTLAVILERTSLYSSFNRVGKLTERYANSS